MKDSSGLVAVILGVLVTLGCGVWWYMSYDEVNTEKPEGLKNKFKAAKETRKAAEEKVAKLHKQEDAVSAIVGMGATLNGYPSVTAMVNHLNIMADRVNLMLDPTGASKKYAPWSLDEGGNPVLKSAEASARELCWIKDLRAPVDLRLDNETKDYQSYLLAELEEKKKSAIIDADKLEKDAVAAIQVHNENVGDGKSGGRLATIVEEKERRIKELRDSIKQTEEATAATARNMEQQIADLEKEVRVKLDDLDQLKDKQEKLTGDARKKIQELQDRVFAIQTKRQVARESTEADGVVINSIPAELTFWVDIGRKDALLRGTRFEVFAMLKGGRKVAKGIATVIDVKTDYAVCQLLRDGIVSMLDGTVYEGKVVENGPVIEITERNGNKVMAEVDKVKRLDYPEEQGRIEKGDYVANEVFDRKRAKTFVYAGKFRGRYTNAQMTNLIKEFGGLVADDVVNETTYLVVGADFEKDPTFEKARNLGVKIIRELDLYEMLGLPH